MRLLPKPDIAGRTWVVPRIEQWLDSSEPSLLITGDAGVGKTALVTHLAAGAAPRLRPHATHLCRAHMPRSTDPVRVLANIAAQLARTVPGYAGLLQGPRLTDMVHELADDAVLDSRSVRAAFRTALWTPLSVLASTGRLDRDVIVAIDGLDEAGSGFVDMVLADHHDRPPRLRLLVTTRPGTIADRLGRAPRVDLGRDQPPGVDDIMAYLTANPAVSRFDRQAIAAGAHGSYVYADLAVRLLEAGLLRLSGRAPEGLANLYRHVLGDMTDPPSTTHRVLCLLGAARDQGLTLRQVAGLLTITCDEVERAVGRCAALLTGARQVRPHHRCLTEHLATSLPPSVEAAAFDWQISRGLAGLWEGRWRTCDQPYVLRHVLGHLADVVVSTGDRQRGQAALAAVDDIVADPDFLTVALARVGVDDVLCAVSYAQRRLPGCSSLRTIASVLRAQAPTLRYAQVSRNPPLAAQQLVFEAATAGAASVSRALVGHVGDGVLTLWATADSPLRSSPDARPGHRGEIIDISMPATGTQAVTSSVDGTTRIWQLASGRIVHSLDTGRDTAAVFHVPGSPHVITQNRDGEATVWNADSGGVVGDIPGGRTALVSAFAVNADGSCGISGDADGNATVWDLTAGEAMVRLPCRAELVTAVAISADGRTAAVGALCGDVAIWDVPTGAARMRLTYPSTVTALALAPSAERIVIGGDRGLSIYAGQPRRRGEPTARLYTHARVSSAAVNPAMPRYLLFGTTLGQVAYVRLP